MLRRHAKDAAERTVPAHGAAAGVAAQRTKPVRDPDYPYLLDDILALGVKIAIILLVLVGLFLLVFGLYRCEDASMLPSIKDGDLVMYYRLDKEYVATDVVVFKQGDNLTCGRVAAVAGDTVNIDSNGLVINGAYVQEDGIYSKTTQLAGGVNFPLTVGPGQVFVLGDNRTQATDGRIIGCIDVSQTEGTVMQLVRRRGI